MVGQAERVAELINLTQKVSEKNNSALTIAFASGKGGTGKSFLALNIGYALARLNKKVLIVDLDFNFSSINIMINQIPENNLSNFFKYEVLLKEIVHTYTSNIHFIFNDNGKTDFPDLSNNDLKYFFDQLQNLKEDYDFILLDTSSGFNEFLITILINSNMNIIVANPEPTSVMDAYSIIKLSLMNNVTTPSKIIFNKCRGEEEGFLAFSNLIKATSHFLKEKPSLLGIIELSAEVGDSIRNQEILCKQNSQSVLFPKITKIAGEIIKVQQVANNNQQSKLR